MSKAKRLAESLQKRRKSISEAHLSLNPEYVKLFELKDSDRVMEFFQPILEEGFEKALSEVRTPSLDTQYNSGTYIYYLSAILSAVQRINSAIAEFHLTENPEDKKLVSMRIEDALEETQRLLAARKASEVRGKDLPVALG